MSIQTLMGKALGYTPNAVPILSGGGVISPSPRWENGPSEAEALAARRRAFGYNGLNLERSVWMAPQHGTVVHHATPQTVGFNYADRTKRPKCDILLSTTPGLLLCAPTADCISLYFEDEYNQVAAMAHAGWMGLQKGVVHRAVSTMLSKGGELDRLTVCVGPFISARRYIQRQWGDKVRYFAEQAACYQSTAGYHCNMETILRRQLRAVGVRDELVVFDGRCTYESPELCSHVQTAETEVDGFQRGSNVMVAGLPE